MRNLKKTIAIFLSAMIVFSSIPISQIAAFAEEDVIDCWKCSGKGYFTCETCMGNTEIHKPCNDCTNGTVETECTECGGTGRIGDEICSNCSGSGSIMSICPTCGGAMVDCPDCADGTVLCTECGGTGKITLAEDDTFKFEDVNDEGVINLNFTTDKVKFLAKSTKNTEGKIKYSSKDEKVAEVDEETGEITLKKAGTVEIEAEIASDGKKYKKATASATLVIAPSNQTIGFEKSGYKFFYGEEDCKVTAKLVGNGGTGDITYDVAENSVVSIDPQTGKLTFEDQSAANVTVTATKAADDCYKEATATCVINISIDDDFPNTNNDRFEITSEKNKDGWYNDPEGVAFKAKSGYRISDTNSLLDFGTKTTYRGKREGKDVQYTLYLRKTASLAISDGFTVTVNYDATAPDDPIVTYTVPETSKDGINYYKDDVEVKFSSSDSISGVDYFEYELDGETKKEFANSEGEATITLTAEQRYELTYVTAYDKAGNPSLTYSTVDDKYYIIDRTSPELTEVLPENTNSDKVNIQDKHYYNYDVFNAADREVGVKLEFIEENFYPEDVIVKLNGNNVSTEGDWNTANKTFTHSLKPSYNDGEYVYSITDFSDRSNNAMVNYKSKPIVVDTVKPTITVGGFEDAVDTVDGINYFNSEKTVTISVSDVNVSDNEGFCSKLVSAKLTAKDINGNEVSTVKDDFSVAIEEPNNWINNSTDTYTFTYTFDEDAIYELTVDCEDLASNKAITYSTKFTVDKSAPEIAIEYNDSLATRVLRTITFGLYQGKTEVTVIYTDKTSPIDEVTYEAKLEDDASSVNTGIDTVTLKRENGDFVSEQNDAGKVIVKFDIDPQFRGSINASAKNRAKLTSQLNELETPGTDPYTGVGVIVDNVAPKVSEVAFTTPDMVTDADNNKVDNFTDFLGDTTKTLYYDNAFDFTISIDEANFDMNPETTGNIIAPDNTVIEINNKEVKVNDTDGSNSSQIKGISWDGIWTKNGDIFSTTVRFDLKDGKYKITAKCTDASNNEMEEYESQDIIVDRYAPEITQFEILTEGYYEDNTAESGKTNPVNPKSSEYQYDFYFQDDTTICVSATDKVAGTSSVAGIEDILLIAKDINNGWVVVTADNDSFTVNGTAASKIFKVSANFKGAVYAIAVDRMGHYPSKSDSAENKTSDSYKNKIAYVDDQTHFAAGASAGFVYPDDVIIETPDRHSIESSIDISFANDADQKYEKERDRKINTDTVRELAGDASRELGTKKDFDVELSKVPLFGHNVTVSLAVEDKHSGIRQVDWYVRGRDEHDSTKNQQGTIKINNDSSYIVDGEAKWDVKSEAGSNLITNADTKVKVTNNSNDIIILVVLTDRAGNKSYDYNVIGIDKTAPKVSLEYDVVNETGAYKGYYNKQRTATISVTDRNFEPKNIVSAIKNIDKKYNYIPNINNIVNISKWNSDNNKANETFTYKIVYKSSPEKDTNNGHFEFAFKCSDLVGNMSNKITDSFYADYERPVVAIDVTGTSVLNNKYFNKARTANIKITEHWFADANKHSDFVNKITSKLNGKDIAKPTNSAFTASGDSHTSHINFNKDGDYKLDFEVTDMAGNKAKVIKYNGNQPKDFTVDMTVPNIDINIKDSTAFIKVPAIKVTQKDNNCRSITTSNVGQVVNDARELVESTIKHSGDSTSKDHQQELIVTYENIKDDGYYVITAYATDMAGNKSITKRVIFTKNEFGSVYRIPDDSAVNKIKNKIVKSSAITDEPNEFFVEELSLSKPKEQQAYFNIGNTKYDDYIKDNGPEYVGKKNGWFIYRYYFVKDKFLADGEYNLYIRSKSDVGNEEVINNENGKAYEKNTMKIGFTIDNENPFVEIKGLENHINNGVNSQKVQLIPSDKHLSYVKVTISNTDIGGTDDIYIWTNVVDAKSENGELVEPLFDENGNVVPIEFTIDVGHFDVQIEVADEAGNIASGENDFNIDDIFTDVRSNRMNNFEYSENNFIKLKSIAVSEHFYDSLLQRIKDNLQIAIAIAVAVVLAVSVLILIPILAKRRKELDEEDEKQLD